MSKGGRARDRNNARRIVEQQKVAERRRRVTIWTSVAVVLVLVAAGITGWVVLSNQQKTTASKLTVPPGVVDDGTAWKAGDGPVKVDLYEDFMCPICNNFQKATGSTIDDMVTNHKITVQYHMVSILDQSSNGTKYSTRAAGAAAAAAIEGKFVQYHHLLYQNQPAEGSDGLTNAKLIELGKSVGLTDAAFVNAVNDETYDAWVSNVTDQFASRGFTGTPTIVVNGKQVQGANDTVPTPQQFVQAVDQAAG
jgi:protein-disulfide isomerase